MPPEFVQSKEVRTLQTPLMQQAPTAAGGQLLTTSDPPEVALTGSPDTVFPKNSIARVAVRPSRGVTPEFSTALLTTVNCAAPEPFAGMVPPMPNGWLAITAPSSQR